MGVLFDPVQVRSEVHEAWVPHLYFTGRWPATFALARAYLDQLERSRGIAADRITAIRGTLTQAESSSETQRRTMLTSLASTLDGEASGARDAAKVRLLAGAVRGMAR